MIFELCELARNMSWFDGLVFGMVVGSNLGGQI